VTRLLFDHNLSERLVGQLADLFPGSTHVRTTGLDRASDRDVWDHAAKHGLIVVSKDADFHQMSFVFGPPPKVVWIRAGNCTTHRIAEILRANSAAVESFVAGDGAFLALG
jgi:predicted nuclease of predicted toxin-antitoxin system